MRAAHKQIHIEITSECIAESKPLDSSHCMIADAVRAAIPEAKAVSVDLATIRFTDPRTQQRYVYLTPGHAQDALVHFDQGLPIQPFSLTLRAPVQVTRAGRAAQKSGGRKTEGVAQTINSKIPTKLGGTLPPRNALTSVGKGAPSELPPFPTDPNDNVTLQTRHGHVRKFGMKQLRPS